MRDSQAGSRDFPPHAAPDWCGAGRRRSCGRRSYSGCSRRPRSRDGGDSIGAGGGRRGAGQAGRGGQRAPRGPRRARSARVDDSSMRLKFWRSARPSTRARRRKVDRRIYLIGASVVVLVFGLYLWAPGFLKTIENKLYDLHFVLRGPQYPGNNVAIVAIDEKSLAAFGRWPWPRSVLARVVRSLAD